MNLLKKSLYGVAAGALLASSLAALPMAAQAQTVFSAPAKETGGNVGFSSPERGKPVLAGSEVAISGRGFKPGQSVTLHYGKTQLTSAPLIANDEGVLEGKLKVPANAQAGNHPIVVVTEAPYNATIANLKVSPNVPLSGAGNYTVSSIEPAVGVYQTAYSAKRNAIFATFAVGRPPVKESQVIRLNADTLAVEASVTPPAAPPRQLPPNAPADASTDGGVYAVYGVGVDDKNDTVWVTNSRQNTVAVYKQSDLSLVRQFEPGTVNHARDVVVNEESGKAYASATFAPEIVVFQTEKPDVLKRIEIKSNLRGETFSASSLSYDKQARRLYVAGNSTDEVAVINTATDEVENVFRVPGAKSVIGVAHDPVTDRIFLAGQGSDNVVILNGKDGSVVADTPVGAGALNVVFDPVKRRAYVSNFGAGTVTVLDADGKIVANLDAAPVANHVSTDGRGNVYAAIKSSWAGADKDKILLIKPKR